MKKQKTKKQRTEKQRLERRVLWFAIMFGCVGGILSSMMPLADHHQNQGEVATGLLWGAMAGAILGMGIYGWWPLFFQPPAPKKPAPSKSGFYGNKYTSEYQNPY